MQIVDVIGLQFDIFGCNMVLHLFTSLFNTSTLEIVIPIVFGGHAPTSVSGLKSYVFVTYPLYQGLLRGVVCSISNTVFVLHSPPGL